MSDLGDIGVLEQNTHGAQMSQGLGRVAPRKSGLVLPPTSLHVTNTP